MNNVGGDGDPDDCGGGAGAVAFGVARVAGGDGAPSGVAAPAQETADAAAVGVETPVVEPPEWCACRACADGEAMRREATGGAVSATLAGVLAPVDGADTPGRLVAAVEAVLNVSPDVSGCPSNIARAVVPVVLRAYADAEHHHGDSQPAICLPGGWIDPDAWCVCGASWGEGGCTERETLLQYADRIEMGQAAA